jgi:hypothetical protein
MYKPVPACIWRGEPASDPLREERTVHEPGLTRKNRLTTAEPALNDTDRWNVEKYRSSRRNTTLDRS